MGIITQYLIEPSLNLFGNFWDIATTIIQSVGDFLLLIFVFIYAILFFVIQYYLIKGYIYIGKFVYKMPFVNIWINKLLHKAYSSNFLNLKPNTNKDKIIDIETEN